MNSFEDLKRWVDFHLGYCLTEETVDFLLVVNEFAKSRRFPPDEWRQIAALKKQVEDALVQELKDDINFALKQGVPHLIRIRNLIKQKVPGYVKRQVQDDIYKMYEALKNGSILKARRFLQEIEGSLSSAEEASANETLSAYRRLQATNEGIKSASSYLGNKIPTHVLHVGLPEVATERGTTVDEILAGFRGRINALHEKTIELEKLVVYEAEHAQEIAQQLREKAEQEAKDRAHRQRLQERATLIAAIAGRSKEAGQACQSFFAHVDNGNISAAWKAMQDILRHDGGIPAAIQRAYSEACASKQKKEKNNECYVCGRETVKIGEEWVCGRCRENDIPL